uniref:FAST kinase domain-containing protein 3 n=1 Tax=Cacopsylla melanoneura TaxID=428564 RepID=A0A8D8VAM1_9HEMI
MNKSLQKLGQIVSRQNIIRYSIRYASNDSNKLRHSTILIQDGVNVQELPIIVRRLSGKDFIILDNNLVPDEEHTNTISETNNKEELAEIINGFNRCVTTDEIFKILDTMPAEEVTPLVALHALQKTYELDNNKVFRNDYSKYIGSDESENFTRTAILNQLIDRICHTNNNDVLVKGLELLSKDVFKSNTKSVKEKLKDEIILQISQNKFTLKQVCDTVRILSDCGNRQLIDTLWVGITERIDEINETNFIDVFQTLLFFKKSRRPITYTLEKKMIAIWYKLKSDDICKLLPVLSKTNVPALRFLEVTSKWIHTNIHTLSEDQLRTIIIHLSDLDYRDSNIENALERYIKMKSIQIKDPTVMAAIMDYCYKFRIRSVHIMQGCAEYLIIKQKELSPVHFKSLFLPFGHLVFKPLNGIQFWKCVEQFLDEKFVNFKPNDFLDVMLACVYLKNYPLNFVDKVFNPFFLDRLQVKDDFNKNQIQRMKLKVLDTALHIECPLYQGPMLPRDYSPTMPIVDQRIKRICHKIQPHINTMIGFSDRISFNVLPPFLPMSDIYVIDVLVHPSFMGRTMFKMNLAQDNLYTAILVHIPEHFCSDGQLIGAQAMRIRHLKSKGFKVVTLEHKILSKLVMYPKELINYISEQMQK